MSYMTPKEYAKNQNISYYKALKYFKSNNMPLEGSGGKNRKVEGNPFSDNQESEYWLGYIAADGNVSSKGNNLTISSKDVGHLKKFGNFSKCNINLSNRGLELAYFGNYSTKEYLISKGITPKKSLTFEYSGNLTSHFIRGVFDGDGSVSGGRPKITSGSKFFIKQLEKLFTELGFKYSILTKGNCFDIYILSKSREDFFNWLYKDADVFLERKYFKYGAYIEKSKYANRVNSENAEMPILSQAI